MTQIEMLDAFLMKKAQEVVDSHTTSSRYYTIEGKKIRLSDHQTGHEQDLNIMVPSNIDSKQFLVTVGDSPKIFAFTINKLKQFIENYLIISCYTQTKDSVNNFAQPLKPIVNPERDAARAELKEIDPRFDLFSRSVKGFLITCYSKHPIPRQLMKEFLSEFSVDVDARIMQSKTDRFFRIKHRIW